MSYLPPQQPPSGFPPAGPPPPPPPYPYGGPVPPAVPPKHLRGYRPLVAMWITLAAAVALFVVGGIVIATKSLGQVGDFERMSIGTGSGTVQLDRTGKWVGYYEADDVTDKIEQIPSVTVRVLDPDGNAVDLQSYGNRSDDKVDKMTYDYDGHRGVAAFQFTIDEPGSYTVQAQAEDQLPEDAGFAFGPDIAGGTIAGALLIVAGGLSLLAAVVLLIVGLVRRGGHKRELRAAGPLFGQ